MLLSCEGRYRTNDTVCAAFVNRGDQQDKVFH